MNLRSLFKLSFVLVTICFFVSCANPKWFWCSSNGIFTYNRHTGQMELIWENSAKPANIKQDTVYVSYPSKDPLSSEKD